jgi:hypothetical protein
MGRSTTPAQDEQGVATDVAGVRPPPLAVPAYAFRARRCPGRLGVIVASGLSGLEDDLGPTVVAIVEMLVRLRSLHQREFVTHDE